MWIHLLALGCTDGGNAQDSAALPDNDNDTPVDEGCAEDSECSSWQICEEEACTTGDRNNSIEEAESILWEDPGSGVLQDDDDQDFFTFTADGGEYIRVDTIADDETNDTIVSLYSPSGKLHAQENDHALGAVTTYDTVLYAYLPVAGDWTILVEDVNDLGSPDYSYEVEVSEYGRNTAEPDAFSSPEILEVESGYYYAVGWLLEEEGDADYVSLELPYEECPTVITGSSYAIDSDATPLYELYDVEGDLLLRKEAPGGENGSAFYFEVDGGQATLSVTDADGGGGASHWGFFYVRVYDRGYHYTAELEENDYDGDANFLDFTWETNDSGEQGTALAWGIMDYAYDEDWYGISVDPDNYLYINGTADLFGSLIDAEVTLYDADGEIVAEGDDVGADDDFSDVGPIGPLDGGDYYIQVTNGNEEYGPATYYRFTAFQTDYPL